jgi:hypothetical protein
MANKALKKVSVPDDVSAIRWWRVFLLPDNEDGAIDSVNGSISHV